MDNRSGADEGMLGEIDEGRFARFLEERQDLRPDTPEPLETEEGLGDEALFDQGIENGGEVIGDEGLGETERGATGEAAGEGLFVGKKNGEAAPEQDVQGVRLASEGVEDFILTNIKVPRNAEALPKAYLRGIEEIVRKNAKDPSRLVEELDKARWDMFGKAYGRKRGDGLAGGKV